MAIDKQNLAQVVQPTLNKPASPGEARPAFLRIATKVAAAGTGVTSPASKEAQESVYAIAAERKEALDAFTPQAENNHYDKELAKEAQDKTKATNTARLFENGKNFAQAVKAQAEVAFELMKEMLGPEIMQALNKQSGGENDPQKVFEKGASSPEFVESYAKDIVAPLLAEKIKKAKEEGNESELASLEAVQEQLNPLLQIFGMGEGINPAKHAQFLGYIADLSEKGDLSSKVAGLVEGMHKSYEDFADSENRFTGILSKVNKSFLSVSKDLADIGDKQARNLLKRLTGAVLTDRHANGGVLDFDEAYVMSAAVPYEPSQQGAAGLLTQRLLSRLIAPAMNRIYVGTLTEEQPYASLVLKDARDDWYPNMIS